MQDFGITNLGLFCLAVMLLNITPGPDTAYIVGRSVAQGRKAGLISALGISAGCMVHAFASAFGLTAIIAASPMAFQIIKYAGGAYLVYLGARMLFSKPAAHSARPAAINTHKSVHSLFGQAMLTNILNPKVVLFFLSFFPQFVSHDSQHQTIALLILGAIFVLLSTLWNSGTALLAGTLARRASRHPHYRVWLERSVGGAFVALGMKLVLTKN